MDKEALLEKLKDQLLLLLNQPGFEDALKGARTEYAAKILKPLPRLKVMACPKNAGKHPVHDNRWIVTANTEIDWNHNETEWAVGVGVLVAQMTDCQNQARYARLFAAAPEMLAALEDIVAVGECSTDIDIELAVETAKAAIQKARG